MSAVLLVNLVVFVTVVAGAGLLIAGRLPLAWRQAALASTVGLVLVAPLGAWLAGDLGQLGLGVEGRIGPSRSGGLAAQAGADSGRAQLAPTGWTSGAASAIDGGELESLSAPLVERPSGWGAVGSGVLAGLRRHGFALGFGALVLAHAAWTLWRWRRGRRVLARLRFQSPSADVQVAWARLAGRFDDLDLHVVAEGGSPVRGNQPGTVGRRPVSLAASPDVATPFVLGSARALSSDLLPHPGGPVLIVPVAWPALTEAETEAVLAHELGHVRAGHLALLRWQAAAWLAYGWHPLVRLLDRALERTKETVADQCATRTRAERHSLAQALVAFATLRTDPAPGHAALELHLSPLTARVEDLLADHVDGPAGQPASELEPPRPLGRREHALLALGTGAIAVLAACSGVRHGDSGEAKGDAQHALLETGSRGPELVVTSTGGTPPAHPDDFVFGELKASGDAWTYPASRRSQDWIGGQAVDFGVTDSGVRVYLTLMHDLVAVDAAAAVPADAVLWSSAGSHFFDQLRFVDWQDPEDGAERRAVRLEASGAGDRSLWVYHDLMTGAELPNPFAEPEPAGALTQLAHWSGSEARRDAPLRTLVTDLEAWEALYTELFGLYKRGDAGRVPSAPPRELDGIDFTKEALLVVYLGRSTHCRGVGLQAAYLEADRLLVRIDEHTYQTAAMGLDGEPYDPPIEHPYGLFRVPRLGPGAELVVERNAQGLIRGPALWTELERFALE